MRPEATSDAPHQACVASQVSVLVLSGPCRCPGASSVLGAAVPAASVASVPDRHSQRHTRVRRARPSWSYRERLLKGTNLGLVTAQQRAPLRAGRIGVGHPPPRARKAPESSACRPDGSADEKRHLGMSQSSLSILIDTAAGGWIGETYSFQRGTNRREQSSPALKDEMQAMPGSTSA